LKRFTVLFLAMAMVLGLASGAGATLFVERFGTDLNVLEEQRAIYNFNLTATGGNSFVKQGGTTIMGPFLPTIDETTFDPLNYNVDSVTLRLRIGGLDKDTGGSPDENIRIWIRIESTPSDLLFDQIDSLGLDAYPFSLPTAYLTDGITRTVAIAPPVNDTIDPGLNDFKVRWAELEVEASQSPTPKPAIMLLLGTGLVGLAVFRRKFRG